MKKIYFFTLLLFGFQFFSNAQLTCGDSLVDSGGSSGTYQNSEIDTFFLCPQNAGDAISLTFLNFNTEEGYDFLTIYDSNQAGTNPIGTYSGIQTLGTITAENPTGCLTIIFTSDGSVTSDGFLASVACVAQPTCLKPSNLQVSGITSTSAIFNWQSNDSELRWILEYGPAGFTPGTGTSVVALTNPRTINTFTPVTNYDLYIRARCSIGDTSSYFGPINFTTSTAPLNCGDTFMDSGLGTGNYQINEDYTYIACPGVSTQTVQVIFSEFLIENGYDFMTIYDANAATPGTEIGTYTGNTSPGTLVAENPTGCLTFHFTSDQVIADSGWVASINCIQAITCFKPTLLTTSNATDISIDLSWTANSGESAWQIQYGPSGFALGTGTVVNANSNPFTINGLTALTNYDFYVRSICSAGDTSSYSTVASDMTNMGPISCGSVFTDLGGQNGNYQNGANEVYVICPTISGQTILLDFQMFDTETGYDSLMIFNGNTITDPLIGSYQGTNSPGQIYSTNANGCLTVNFISDGSVTYAGWVAAVQCVAPITCIQPSNFTATSISDTSISLSWTTNSAETQWVIEYDTTGFTPGTGMIITANSNPFTINGLNATTAYDFYITSVCSVSDSSFVTGPAMATTMMEPFICGNLFIDNGGAGNYNPSSSDTITICPNGLFEQVTVNFISFETEQNFDSLMVFNGSTVNGTLIGTYQGQDTLGLITSTSTDGCLTFVFVSDGSVQYGGWTAEINCVDLNASVSENNMEFVSVFPNPSNAIFNVQNLQSQNLSYTIKDLQGRALSISNNELKSKEISSIDLSKYENGIYFLIINESETITLVKN